MLNRAQFGPTSGCSWCSDPSGDPAPDELHQACDSCLDTRSDPAVWDPSYAARAESVLLSRAPAPGSASEAFGQSGLMSRTPLRPRDWRIEVED